MDKKAFTLAEVLITLSILGILAAIVVPNIISHYRKTYTENRLKQVYSILDNALEMAKIEYNTVNNYNGLVVEAYNNKGDMSLNASFLKNIIAPYINYKKTCFDYDYSCYDAESNSFHGLEKEYEWPPSRYHMSYLVLKNGSQIGIDGSYFGTAPSLSGSGYIIFWVDINGNKSPNTIGKDIFYFKICPNCYYNRNANGGQGYLEGGRTQYEGERELTCSGVGWHCAAVIRRNGWKIPKDYPKKF